jgi:3-carboxy-cis,cis-muconate cycloisomerase
MSFSALDSALTGPLLATERMRALFSDRARLAAMIEVETALARAQARCGLVSPDLAPALDAITPEQLDIEAIGRETGLAGVPVIPFVKAVRGLLPPAVEPDFHKGATTQDIADTALVLQTRRAFALIAEDAIATMKALQALASTHARTLCAGRTYGQHAAPVSFGYKVAVWNMGIADVALRAREMRERSLVASLGGPVGTLAGMGARRLEIADAFAAELGLAPAPISWHTRRAGIADAGHWLAMLIGSLARMAGDVAHLASTEVAEVAEPHQPGRGGSSAMPHKRNPVSCTVILAAASAARGLALPLLDAMVSTHERPAGAWHAEWHALPQLFGLASGALREARVLAEGLEVDPARMAANLEATRGLLFADAVAAELAPSIGAGAAHRIVTQAADAGRVSGEHLRDVLARDHAVAGSVLDRAFDVTTSVDAAAAWIARVDPEIKDACERLR